MPDMGVTVAIIEGTTILLTLRQDFEVWCMPGGDVDAHESLADAARREVREETGLEVELTRLVGTYSRVGWRPYHNFLFAAQVVAGTLMPDPHEVIEARFFPFDALPEFLYFGHDDRIRDASNGVVGVVKTEHVSAPASPNRSDLYALRDQSGLSGREFYQQNVGRVHVEQITVEVAGRSGSSVTE